MAESSGVSTKKPGVFEIHIEAPKIDEQLANLIIESLQGTGFLKNKYFTGVYNVPQDPNFPHPLATPPVGHDLNDPYLMSTAISNSYEAARRLVLDGMHMLDTHGISGNFEIEHVIAPHIQDVKGVNISDFPGFQTVQQAPVYEVHLFFKGPLNSVDKLDEIINNVQRNFGVTPHQIVDFSRKPVARPDTPISRVVTIYQPGRIETLELAERIRSAGKLPSYSYSIAEQVCLVGTPAKR
ncbi:hypothetical protein HYS31_08565 [Candidatus Woesearchaeota archaeon]|nr:hypothetical protein [Candidatus Woesearchaeota archaeon]